MGNLPCWNHYTNCYVSAREKARYPRTWMMSRSLPLQTKGGRSDCNNYKGISLLSIVGKVFAIVVLTCLQVLAERMICTESQCGFRAKKSTMDMIFLVHQLQEKCQEQHTSLYIAFIDLTKALAPVSRKGLFRC